MYGSNEVCEDGISYYDDNLSSNSLEWSVVNGIITIPASPPYIANGITVNWNQGSGSASINAIATQTGIFCQQSASYPVNIFEKPQEADSISGDSIICPNATYLYTVSETNATSPQNLRYQWAITGGTPATADGESVMITWDPVGPYSISVSNHLESSVTKVYKNLPKNIKLINLGITEPEEIKTFPKRTIVKQVLLDCPERPCRINSAMRLVTPIVLVGLTALSVEIKTKFSTFASIAASANIQVPIVLLKTP